MSFNQLFSGWKLCRIEENKKRGICATEYTLILKLNPNIVYEGAKNKRSSCMNSKTRVQALREKRNSFPRFQSFRSDYLMPDMARGIVERENISFPPTLMRHRRTHTCSLSCATTEKENRLWNLPSMWNSKSFNWPLETTFQPQFAERPSYEKRPSWNLEIKRKFSKSSAWSLKESFWDNRSRMRPYVTWWYCVQLCTSVHCCGAACRPSISGGLKSGHHPTCDIDVFTLIR